MLRSLSDASKVKSIFCRTKDHGHARPSITSDIYGHLVPGSMSEIGDIMDEMTVPIPVKLPYPEVG